MSESSITEVAAPATAIPAAGTWDADLAHSSLEFVARHLMTTKVRGRFNEWSATLTTGATPGEASVVATINPRSITTFNEQRDQHLLGGDFFDIESYPTAEFRSTRISDLDDEMRLTVEGELTARGITRQVTLEAEFLGVQVDPFGNTKATFSAHTDISREDWGFTWNVPLAGGGVLVSKKIRIEVEVQFALRKDQGAQQ